ncbi:MAG TPA: hypothetical protein VEH57_06735 [Thermoplasmata archaeon]|nr:hypothetical protein [Thermoplasmata archaeon]
MANLGGAIALLVMGFSIVIFGAIGYSVCSSAAATPGMSTNCGGFGWVIGFGVIILLSGVVLLVVGLGEGRGVIQEVPDPSVPPPLIQPVVVQQTVERQVVKVRCTYCGNLYDVTAKSCPSCGAPVG